MGDEPHPKTIGPYRILGVLGEGGMGRVYRAEQPSLQREVALKVLGGQFAGRADMGERFLREARAMARISHPNVLTCYDVGTHDGGLFMALELVSGGDAADLLKRRGGRLPEDEALRLIRDAAAGLEAIEEAGLIHRDIKPANIFLTDRDSAKLADLGLARNGAEEGLTSPGVPIGTPSYMSPEQAEGGELDIRSDIYALGATLWCLLLGRPPFVGDSPVATLVKVLNDVLPDPGDQRPELGRATRELLSRALARARCDRHPRALDLRLDCERALDALANGGPSARSTGPDPVPDPAAVPRSVPGSSPARSWNASAGLAEQSPRPDSPAPAAGGATPTPQIDPAKIGHRQLLRLAGRVHVGEDGLEAWINLAPQASMPAALLQRLLEVRGVVYGLVEGAVLEASRRSDQPRRIPLAIGDHPSPGVCGRDVRGNELAPAREPVVITINDDATLAHALFRPGEVVDRAAVERMVKGSGLRFGIDRAAITRLWEGPPIRSGRALIASGRPVREGVAAGFTLAGPVAEVSLTGGEVRNLAKVARGTLLATWQDERSGKAGMTVYGARIPPRALPDRDPDRQAGEGTDLTRGREGVLELRAAIDGFVQQRHDGTIRVVAATEVAGDLGPDDGPVSSDDVVVVRGSVRAGARISSGSDVVIMGDLADATIEAGGSIEIHGDVGHGDEAIRAGDAIAVDGTVARKLIAGNLTISGTVDRCELVATGDIRVGSIVGGSLRAGGSICCDRAGDRLGTTTELYAGSSVGYEEQARLADLAERRLASERARLHRVMGELQQQVGEAQRRDLRHQHAAWVNERVVERQRGLLRRLEEQQSELKAEAEAARTRLANQRGVVAEIKDLAADPDAGIEVRGTAYHGVVAGIAGSDPIRIDRDRDGLRLGQTGGEAHSRPAAG